MSVLKEVLRWICLIPAGLIAAGLVMFPLHWIVMINLGGWGMEPLIEIRDIDTLRNIEMILQAAFGPLAFVYCAARIAPRYRQATSILLSGVIVIGLPILTHWWNANTVARGSGLLLNHGFGRFLANVVGAAVAIYLVRSHERTDTSS